jgi:maleate isomerase
MSTESRWSTRHGSTRNSTSSDKIEPDAVVEWTGRHVADDADAVFMGGNGFRAASEIEDLEAATGRPVLESNQVLLWNLLAHAGATFTVGGHGKIFERKQADTR